MNFDLALLGIAAVGALIFNFFVPQSWRESFLLTVSVTALFWLQPPLPIRWSGFLLPFFLLFLVIWSWWLTKPADQRSMDRQSWQTLAIVLGLVLLLACVRYLPPGWRPTLNRPPGIEVVGALAALFALFMWLIQGKKVERFLFGMLIIIGLFVMVKTEWIVVQISTVWRTLANQNPSLAASTDIFWLGFSYIAFRLLHTIRDRQTGQLPDLSLQKFVSYTLFFPALLAGPIDRAERFSQDWDRMSELTADDWPRWQKGLTRIVQGLGKKFILADALALGLSLNPTVATQTDSVFWLWILLYGYAFRLYFDFSGYTDIAIGVGILFGIELPENFDRPYWQSTITAFWQRWHMTLSSWVRFYVFSPLSRALLRRKPRPSPQLIVFVSQMATMIIIGLWHGITINFLIWGTWHGLGLFIHKIWSDRTRKWYRQLQTYPRRLLLWTWFTRFITFHFVVIGWVWFVIPDFASAVDLLGRLVGY